MGRFSTMLSRKSPSLAKGITPPVGSRFRQLDTGSVATYDKRLYAEIMGVAPAAPAALPRKTAGEILSSPALGSWKKPVEAFKQFEPGPVNLRAVEDKYIAAKAAPLVKPVLPGTTLKQLVPSQVRQPNARETRLWVTPKYDQPNLKQLANAGIDALDQFWSQKVRGVNGLAYLANDLLIKTNAPPLLYTKSQRVERRKIAAMQMELAGKRAQEVVAANKDNTFSNITVMALNGGLSLLESVAIGYAVQGLKVGGELLTHLGPGGDIAIGQLAKQYGVKVATQAVAQAMGDAAQTVGYSKLASWVPAVVTSAEEGGSIYKELLDQGKSTTQAAVATLLSIAGTAASEAISLDHLYSSWLKNVHASISARFVTALGEATFETVQELGQNLWQNGVRMLVGGDTEQKLSTWQETLDTVIGIFPSSFLFGGGTFNWQSFQQEHGGEANEMTAKISMALGVDQETATKMAAEAVEQFGPAVSQVFRDSLTRDDVQLAEVLTFLPTTNPYSKWLVAQTERQFAARKVKNAEQGKRFTALFEEQKVAPTPPGTPAAVPGRIPRAVDVPTGYTGQVDYSEPVAAVTPQTSPATTISTGRPNVSIPTPVPAPVVPPAAVTPVQGNRFRNLVTPATVEPTIFNAPAPVERNLFNTPPALITAKKEAVVATAKVARTEAVIARAGQEAAAQQQQAEDMDLWMKTPDELATFEMQRKMQAQFDGSDQGQKSAALRQEIAKLQSGEFTDAAKADLVAKKAEVRRLHASWEDAHGWLSQVNRAVDLGLYDEAITNGSMTTEQVAGIMQIRQQMQSNQDLRDTADEQLNETKRLRLAIEQQREGTAAVPFTLTEQAEPTTSTTGKASEAWVGGRNPTGRELLMYAIRHYPMNKNAFDDYYGGITPVEKANRAKGEQARSVLVKGLPLLGQLMPNAVAQGEKRVGMDELVSILQSELGLTFPEHDEKGEKADDVLAKILYEAAGKDQKNATVDYLGAPLETPAARAVRAKQQTPVETNPEDFANVVNEPGRQYTPEQIARDEAQQAADEAERKKSGVVETAFGKQKWSGVVDLRDGTVEQAFTYDQSENGDFHHMALVSAASLEGMDSGEKSYFWIERDGTPMNWENDLTPEIQQKILDQMGPIKTRRQLTDEYEQSLVREPGKEYSSEEQLVAKRVAALPDGADKTLATAMLSQIGRYKTVFKTFYDYAAKIGRNDWTLSQMTAADKEWFQKKTGIYPTKDDWRGMEGRYSPVHVDFAANLDNVSITGTYDPIAHEQDILRDVTRFLDRIADRTAPAVTPIAEQPKRRSRLRAIEGEDIWEQMQKTKVRYKNLITQVDKITGKESPAVLTRLREDIADFDAELVRQETELGTQGATEDEITDVQDMHGIDATLDEVIRSHQPPPFARQPQVREDNLFTGQEKTTPTAPRPAFSKQALQQAEAAKGGLQNAVEATRELTTRQATQQQEELDHDSLFGGITTGTDNLFDQKVEERNPERGRALVPDEDLFSNATKQEIKKRESEARTKETEALQKAVTSVKSQAWLKDILTVGDAISRQFIYNGSLELTGHIIRTMEDHAAEAQIFRSPLVETIRYIFTNDQHEVVLVEARSSHMPSWSVAFLADKAADVKAILARAKAKGATHLTMQHNHPSGHAQPSGADFKLTHEVEYLFCKGTGIALDGHVIVDSQQYSVIHTTASDAQNGMIRGHDPYAFLIGKTQHGEGLPGLGIIKMEYTADIYPIVTDDSYMQPFLDHPFLNQKILDVDNLVDFAVSLKKGGAYVTVIYTDVRSKVKLVQEMPYNWYTTAPVDEIMKFMQDRGPEYGVVRAFALYGIAPQSDPANNDFARRSNELLKAGALTDALVYDDLDPKMGFQSRQKAGVYPKNGGDDMGRMLWTMPALRVQEDTPTGYANDDPKGSYSAQNLRFVDALFTDFDDIVASFHGLPAEEYQKAVEGWWQKQVWEQLKAAKIPADVFKPTEILNRYRMSKGPKSTQNNMEWIKNKLEAWVREQATTELKEAKTKNLQPNAALDVEQAARQAGVAMKPGNVLAPQPTKKTVAFLDPIWQAIEAKGGYVQHPNQLGTDASTKDLLNIVNTYEGAAQQTSAYRKATRGMLNDSVNTRSHTLAELLGGGEALAKPFTLPVISTKTSNLLNMDATKGKLRHAAQGVEALEYVFRRLDKGVYHGPFWRTFYQPINNAKDYELRMEDRIQTALNQKIAELGLEVKKMVSEEQTIPSDVRPEGVKLTVDDMMAVYLHSKNMDNLRHLLSPTGNRFTKQEVLNVIEALTPEQIKLADWMQATRQLDGIMAAQVTWDTKLKNMLREQNYWMIERQTRDVAVQNVEEELMERIEAGKGITPTQVSAPFTKERTHIAGNPIKLQALESFINGEAMVQHYIATMPIIDQLTRITGNSEFAMAYINKEGKSGWLMLHKWLQDVANPDLATGGRNQYERTMRWVRGNAASALLGFRLAQFFKAGLSWWVGAAEEGDMNAVRGVLSFVGNREETYELVRKYAPQVYHRSMEREIAEAKIAQAIDRRLAAKMTFREATMIFTVAGDRLSVMGLWKGQFDSYLRAHPGVDPQVAADRASEVVRLTQAAWDTKDQPEIQRSGEGMKLLTMFTNEVTRHYNYLNDSVMQYRNRKLPFGQLLRRLIEVLIVQGLIMGSINRKKPPKDLAEAVNDIAQMTLEIKLPVLGRYLTAGMDGFVDSSPAGIKLLQEMARLAGNVTKIPTNGVGPTIGSVASVFAYFYGLPVEGVKDVYKFLTPDQVKKAGGGLLPKGF